MKLLSLLAVVAASPVVLTVNSEWLANRTEVPAINGQSMELFQNFIAKYNKRYDAKEWAYRAGVFSANLAIAAEQQRLNPHAEFGVTKFMDLTKEEFKARYLTYRPSAEASEQPRVWPKNVTANPPTLDWRTKHAVTPVKDQGQCGSCWAFSTTEAIESFAFLSGKYNLTKLSPQQINSCDLLDGGCDGGNPPTAYTYVKLAGGLQDEASYPYTSGITGDTGICLFRKSQVKVSISGYQMLAKNEAALKDGVQAGPNSICVSAATWQVYIRGVMTFCPKIVDHCVQLVGYDDTFRTPYWTVRNSWNIDWGELGYIRLAQGKNMCNLDSEASYPTF